MMTPCHVPASGKAWISVLADDEQLRNSHRKAGGLSHQVGGTPHSQGLIQVFVGQELIQWGWGGVLIKKKPSQNYEIKIARPLLEPWKGPMQVRDAYS